MVREEMRRGRAASPQTLQASRTVKRAAASSTGAGLARAAAGNYNRERVPDEEVMAIVSTSFEWGSSDLARQANAAHLPSTRAESRHLTVSLTTKLTGDPRRV